MLIQSKKKFWILLLFVVLFYSIVYVLFPNPIGQILSELKEDNTQSSSFFNSIFNTYNNVVIQFGFRIIGIIITMYLTNIIIKFLGSCESKIHSTSFNKNDADNIIYDLELFNILVLIIVIVITIIFRKSPQLINNYANVSILFLGWFGKLIIVYIPFIKRTKLFITPILGIILSAIIIGMAIL